MTTPLRDNRIPVALTADSSRFARILALGDGSSTHSTLSSRRDEDGALGDEGDPEAVEQDTEAARAKQPRPARADSAFAGPAVSEPLGNDEVSSTARASPRPTATLASAKLLGNVQVHQLPDGGTALRLRISTEWLAGDVNVDLRLERGKLRAALGVTEGRSYRLLRGSLGQLEGALAARGIAAHPVSLELRASADRATGSGKRQEGRGGRHGARVSRRRRRGGGGRHL